MNRQVQALQRDYPLIYLACHVDHVRARSTPFRLSAADSMLLSHLDEIEPTSAGELARHWGVAASTMSATLQRIEAQGYIVRRPRAGNRRVIELRLTAKGAEAMAAASVLDENRVRHLLARLTVAERYRALAGLAILARAAKTCCLDNPRRRRPER